MVGFALNILAALNIDAMDRGLEIYGAVLSVPRGIQDAWYPFGRVVMVGM